MRTTTAARTALPLFVIVSLALPLAAQTHEHSAATAVPALAIPSADAQRAFAVIKTLSGRWQGVIVDPMTKKPVAMEASLRVTSHGNSVVHEMKAAGDADDPSKNDHPVTMMYLDGANLVLTHYCDAGNRPRMAARISPDGRQVDFDFLDVSGPTSQGHMQHVRFTFVDSTRHLEEWTWALPNGTTMGGQMELHRVESVAPLPAK